MARLGFGQIEPHDRRLSRSVARVLFLEAIAKHVPDVLDDLRDNVLPAYRHAVASSTPAKVERLKRRMLRAPCGSRALPPGFVELWAALLDWAREYRLVTCVKARPSNRWILDQALKTLHYWAADPKLTEEPSSEPAANTGDCARSAEPEGPETRRMRWPCFPSVGVAYPYTEAEQRLGDDRGPDLLFETHKVAEKRLSRIGGRARIRNLLQRLLRLAADRGFVPTPQVRDRAGTGNNLALQWLALYVCDHRTIRGNSGLALEYGLGPSSVHDQIHRAAHLAGFTLPPSA